MVKGTESFTTLQMVGCFEAVCKGNQLYVKGQDTKMYACKRQGEIARIVKYGPGRDKTTVPIVCPSTKEVCSGEIGTTFTSRRPTSRKPTSRRSPMSTHDSKLSKTAPTQLNYKYLHFLLHMLFFQYKFSPMSSVSTCSTKDCFQLL